MPLVTRFPLAAEAPSLAIYERENFSGNFFNKKRKHSEALDNLKCIKA